MNDLVHYLVEYRYWALLIAAMVEGPVTAFVAGSLVALGIFNPFIAIGILAFKDLVMDTGLYALGRMAEIPFFAKQVVKIRASAHLADRILSSIEQGWRDHPARLMWIGKLAYGLSAWFIVSAGLARLPFSKFYLYTLPVTAFQFGGLMVLGYFLGATMWKETQWWIIAIQIAIPAAAVFFLLPAITRQLRKRFVEKN